MLVSRGQRGNDDEGVFERRDDGLRDNVDRDRDRGIGPTGTGTGTDLFSITHITPIPPIPPIRPITLIPRTSLSL
jgi:hypothetical protein